MLLLHDLNLSCHRTKHSVGTLRTEINIWSRAFPLITPVRIDDKRESRKELWILGLARVLPEA